MAAHQALPSLGFFRQEHWSGLPFPSPMQESEKWKWSCSVMSNSLRPHGLQPTRLLHPWDKAYGGDGIPADLCKILKDDAVKVLQLICQQIWKTQQCLQDWKRSVFILIPKKGNAKEISNYSTIAFISHTSKVRLKILQGRLQQYVNLEIPDVQAGFRKGRGPRDQIVNIYWITGKARELKKTSYFIDYA